MLKLRNSDTAIPTVYRVGATQTTGESSNHMPILVCGKSPAPLPQSPLATPVKSPVPVPVIVSGQATNAAVKDQSPFAEEFLSSRGSIVSDVLGEANSVTTALSRFADVAERPESPLSIRTPSEIYHQLWPRVNQEMMHLNAVQALKAEGSVVHPIENTATKPITHPVSPVSSIKSIVDGYRTPPPVSSNIQESHCIASQLPADDQQESVTTDALQQSCLDSALMDDTNVPDGQIFPPGAEFVKGWHMVNNGGLPWPTTTEVQFVAGEMFAPGCNTALRAKVGVAHPGQDLDIWTGDLKVCAFTQTTMEKDILLTSAKAPDVPGRYVGYWRLNDGQGNFFGSSVWIE